MRPGIAGSVLFETNEDCSGAAFELDFLWSDSGHHVPHDALAEANHALVEEGVRSRFGPGYATQFESVTTRKDCCFDKDPWLR